MESNVEKSTYKKEIPCWTVHAQSDDQHVLLICKDEQSAFALSRRFDSVLSFDVWRE